jgi:TDG/mug DNA glycosylase family protein
MIKYQISYGLKIVFIGINPHPGSYQRGIPFSNNKMFWYLLHDAGLIDEPREFLKDDTKLKYLYTHEFKKKYHFGLLNLIDRQTKSTVGLKRQEALPGSARIMKNIIKYQPKVVCFVGKITYQLFSGLKDVAYGWQSDIGASKIYVMHAPHHGLASVRIKDLKKIVSALLVLIMVATTCAMELQRKPQEITFKSLQGFPLISLNKGSSWFKNLSEKKRNKLHEHIIHHNDTCLLALFNFATQMPVELQKTLALTMFRNNENAARKFLNDPIVDVLECYAWVQEQFEPHHLLSCCSSLTPEIIFEHSKDFMVFTDVMRRSSHDAMCSKHELETLAAACEKFKLNSRMFGVRYQFYERLTINNFIKQFNVEQLGLLFFVVATYINLIFPATYHVVLDQDVVEYNKLAEQFNAAVDSLNQETGNQFSSKSVLYPYKTVFNSFSTIKGSSWIPVIVSLIHSFHKSKRCPVRAIDEVTHKVLWLSGISLFGLIHLIYFVGPQFEPASPWGVGCMAGLYGLLCCGYNAVKMHSWRDGWVSFDKLSELLQRDDIVIK